MNIYAGIYGRVNVHTTNPELMYVRNCQWHPPSLSLLVLGSLFLKHHMGKEAQLEAEMSSQQVVLVQRYHSHIGPSLFLLLFPYLNMTVQEATLDTGKIQTC